MPLRAMRKNAAKMGAQIHAAAPGAVILNATKISVDMIERLSSDIMKGMPNGTRFAAEQTMKYVVLWWARHYFKDTERTIEQREDRLNLYKGLQSGYNDDADEAVMLVSKGSGA
jgi:uncharacterized protein YeaC (DUF1315 family)